jgi:hypothetical protein
MLYVSLQVLCPSSFERNALRLISLSFFVPQDIRRILFSLFSLERGRSPFLTFDWTPLFVLVESQSEVRKGGSLSTIPPFWMVKLNVHIKLYHKSSMLYKYLPMKHGITSHQAFFHYSSGAVLYTFIIFIQRNLIIEWLKGSSWVLPNLGFSLLLPWYTSIWHSAHHSTLQFFHW